jgi:tRNA acetyltransferase TAN1
MMRDFNLIVTTARGNEEDACSEIWYLLGEIGDTAAEIEKTAAKGLIVARTALDPFDVIAEFRGTLGDQPEEFRYSLRIIPIERVVQTDLEEIQEVATELASKIRADETFRVTVEKRFSGISSSEIIQAAAVNIDREVSLEDPNRIVLVEVIGERTGVSVIEPTDILSIRKERLDV